MSDHIWVIVRRGLLGEDDATVVAFTDEKVAAEQLRRLQATREGNPWPDCVYETEQCWIDDVSLVDEQIEMDKEIA